MDAGQRSRPECIAIPAPAHRERPRPARRPEAAPDLGGINPVHHDRVVGRGSPLPQPLASGRIHYIEQGSGPAALFVHGVLLNSHVWRHQLRHLADIRRCIAVDLLAHGDTEIAADQEVSVTANANMLREVLDALNIGRVDLAAPVTN